MSHPVGTTIRATNLFMGLPVRKQNAEKESTKTIQKIHKLLRAYTFAKPFIRFSFKVLKTKNLNQNFIYAPKVGATSVKDAALKILNRDCVTQCFWNTQIIDQYEFRALLPKPQCDVSKINHLGQYIAIDGRPVSHTRGTLKQFCTVFKEQLKKHDGRFNKIKDPFLCLNVICPSGTYDINIEPAKDDVLFTEPTRIVAAIEEFFVSVYQEMQWQISEIEIETTSPRSPNKQMDISSETLVEPRSTILDLVSSDTFITDSSSYSGMEMFAKQSELGDVNFGPIADSQLFESAEVGQDVASGEDSISVLDQDNETESRDRICGSSMYRYEEDDVPFVADATKHIQNDIEELRHSQNGIQTSNPWVFAKMTAPSRSRMAFNRWEGMELEVTPVVESLPVNERIQNAILSPQIRSSPVISRITRPHRDSPLERTGRTYEKSHGVTSRKHNQHILSARRVSTLSSPNSSLNRPFKLPSQRKIRSGYDSCQDSNSTMVPHGNENQDIRKFFGENSSSMGTLTRRNQAFQKKTISIADNNIAFPDTISEYTTPEATQRSIAFSAGPQGNQSFANTKRALPLNDTDPQLPASDDIVSLDIVNFFCSSPVTSSLPPRGRPVSFLSSFNEAHCTTPPLEVVPLEAQTHNLVKRMSISMSQLLYDSKFSDLHLVPFRALPINITDSEIPLAQALAMDRATSEKWTCVVVRLFTEMYPDAQLAENLRLEILENMRKGSFME